MGGTDILLDQMQRTTRDFVLDLIEDKFISDYGIISAVNGDGTIDVKHAIIRTLKAGGDLGITETKNIEVMWPSVGQLSIKADLAIGDKVWLVGMKHYLPTLNITAPTEQTVYYSYTRETMKAVPVALFDGTAKVTITAKDGKLSLSASNGVAVDAKAGTVSIKNTAQSLKTLLDTLIDDLTTMSATPAVPGSPIYAPGAAQWPALKALFDELLS